MMAHVIAKFVAHSFTGRVVMWPFRMGLHGAGRSETEVEYSVGFDADGIISALECKAWCLAGAFLDLAWNDLYGVMTGLDQVSSLPTPTPIHLEPKRVCLLSFANWPSPGRSDDDGGSMHECSPQNGFAVGICSHICCYGRDP